MNNNFYNFSLFCINQEFAYGGNEESNTSCNQVGLYRQLRFEC